MDGYIYKITSASETQETLQMGERLRLEESEYQKICYDIMTLTYVRNYIH